jgi:hypothetical protein
LAAAAAGSDGEARVWLRDALRGAAWLGPWRAAKARDALAAL